jgi:two-component system sensor histidine kinase UhpB
MKDHPLEGQKLQWLLASAVDAMLMVDRAGKIVLANEPVARLFGYSVEQLHDMPLENLLPERYRGHHAGLRQEFLAHSKARNMGGGKALFGLRANGEEFPVEVSLSPLRTDDGWALVMATIHDISERKAAERALQESEARMRAIFETAVDAILTIDAEGRVDRFNPAAQRLFGYSEAEVIGKNISMLMPSPDRERHDSYLKHYHETGQKKIIGIGREVTGKRKDGSVFPMDLSVAETFVGERRMFTGIVRDVTERHEAIKAMRREFRALEEKRQAEAKFRKLVEQVQAIIYIVDPKEPDRLMYISPQIKMLGFTPEEWLDDPELPVRQIHQEDRKLAMEAIYRCRSQGVPLRTEYRLLGRNGRALWFRDEAEAVTDDSGRHMFVQGILVNITQNKLAEEALRSSQDELRRLAAHQEQLKEEERKRIAREIHDELGGQLTSIKAYVSVSVEQARARGEEPDPLLSEAADMAKSAIETVRRVITDLRPSVLDQLGVWAALEWYVDRVQKMSGLRCVCAIDEELAAIEVDAELSTMLFRVLQEALTNVVRHAEASEVRVAARLQSGVIVLEIVDNGKGIDTGRLLNRESMGLLGMYERTRHFGGELKISGIPGKGTSVVLRLSVDGKNG